MQFEVSLALVQAWDNGGNGEITIKNKGSTLKNWSFQLSTSNYTITSFWALTLSGSNVQPPAWKDTIAAGEVLISGFAFTSASKLSALSASSSTVGVTILNPSTTQPSTPTPTAQPSSLTTSKKVFGYFTEWSIYDRKFSVDQIKANQLTHVLYAFMLPNPSQEDYTILKDGYPFPPNPYNPSTPEATLIHHDGYEGPNNMAKLKQLKLQYPHLKVLVSIGGWTLSWTLSKIAANDTLRQRLVQTAVKFIVDNGLDGLDVDWEYPGKKGEPYNYVDPINDKTNLLRLLGDLRAEMNAKSAKKLELTCAVGCDPLVIKNYKGAAPYLDYILLMTYDFAGDWGDGGHQTAIYNNPAGTDDPQWNVHAAVNNVILAGFSKTQICVGSPMYGRGWAKIVPTDVKLPIYGKSVSGPGVSYSGTAGEPGLSSYRHLIDAVGKNGLTRYYDPIAKAVYAHNLTTGETWTYEDEQTLGDRVKYILDNDLGGIMFWELSDDTRDGTRNLLQRAVNLLNSTSTTTTTTTTSTSSTSTTTTTSTTTSTTTTPSTTTTTTPSTSTTTSTTTTTPSTTTTTTSTTTTTTTTSTTTTTTTTPSTTTTTTSTTTTPSTPSANVTITLTNNGITDYILKPGKSVTVIVN
jgi:chitinase